MKRLVLIALAVLLPFAALVLWGLSRSEPAPVVLPPEPIAPPVVQAPVEPPAHVPVAVVAPIQPQPGPPMPVEMAPPAVRPRPAPMAPEEIDAGRDENPVPPELSKLQPVFMQCVHDSRRREGQPISFVVEYEVTGDRFTGGRVSKSTLRDPRFAACVEDAFLDLQPAVPTANGTHTYTFRLDPNPQRPE